MIALVTGGTRGIGLAMVKALRKAGHQVAVIGRHEAYPECDLFIRADLRHRHDRFRLIAHVVEALGGIDILVNNAGAQQHQSALNYGVTEWDDNLALMLTAPFDLSQQAGKWMMAHDGGHIVNVLSTAAFQGARNIIGYTAAKHGLLGVTRALAVELAPKVRVNAIAPGLIETDMTKHIDADRRELLNSITPAGRFGTPEEIADALLWLINTTYVYGQTIIIDGGWMVKNG